jgi:hypothetical protein
MPDTTTIEDVVTDQDDLAILNNIFENADTNVANIATVFTKLQESKNTISDYKYKVDSYKIYEDIIDARLEQLDDFCSDRTNITNSENKMTLLETTVNNTTENYTDIVSQNNLLAKSVNTQYDVVKGKLTDLAKRSSKLGQNVDNFTKLVANKRAPGYASMLFVKIVPKTYAPGDCLQFDTFATTTLATNTFKLNKDFLLSKEGSFDYIYNGKYPETSVQGQAQQVKIKIETLASIGKIIDTTSVFLLNHDSRVQDSTPTITNILPNQLSVLNLQKNERLFIKVPASITITSGVVKIFDFNVN